MATPMLTPEPNRQQQACALFGWRVSNLLDSMTDLFYSGGAPDKEDFARITEALDDVELCGIDTHQVLAKLQLAAVDVKDGQLAEAKSNASDARSTMQRLLEEGSP